MQIDHSKSALKKGAIENPPLNKVPYSNIEIHFHQNLNVFWINCYGQGKGHKVNDNWALQNNILS